MIQQTRKKRSFTGKSLLHSQHIILPQKPNNPKNCLVELKNNANALLQLSISAFSIIALFILLVLIVVEGVKELNRPRYWIEPLYVPKLLEELGYSGQVISNRLLSNLNQFTTRINSKIISYQMLDTWSGPSLDMSTIPIILPPKIQNIDIIIPKSGLSYNNIKYFLFSKLSNSTTISGDITFGNKEMNTLNMSVNINNSNICKKNNLKFADIDKGIGIAAENIIKKSNPILLAFYYYENSETKNKLKCLTFIRNNIENLRKKVGNQDLLALYRLYGLLLIQNGNYQEAISLYKEIIDEFPASYESRNDLGIAYIKQENYIKAISCFNENLKIKKKSVRARANIATCYIKLNEYEKAELCLNEAKNIDPGYEAIYHRRGLIKYNKKQFIEAIKDFKRAIDLNKKYFFAYNSLGKAYDEIEEYQDAIKSYKAAIRLEPSYSNVYNNLGVTYWKLREYDKAEINLNKFIQLSPQYAAGYINLGLVQKNQKKYQEAIQSFAKAAILAPEESSVYFNWGLTLHEWGKFEEAIEKYKKAIKINPDYEKAKNNLEQLQNQIRQ